MSQAKYFMKKVSLLSESSMEKIHADWAIRRMIVRLIQCCKLSMHMLLCELHRGVNAGLKKNMVNKKKMQANSSQNHLEKK